MGIETLAGRLNACGHHGILAGGDHQAIAGSLPTPCRARQLEARLGWQFNCRPNSVLLGRRDACTTTTQPPTRTENQPNRRAVGAMPERVGLRPRLHRANLVLDRRGRTRPVDRAVGLLQPRGLAGQRGVLRNRLALGPTPAGRSFRTPAGRRSRPGELRAPPPFRRGRWPRGSARCKAPASIRGVMWITVTPVSVSPL